MVDQCRPSIQGRQAGLADDLLEDVAGGNVEFQHLAVGADDRDIELAVFVDGANEISGPAFALGPDRRVEFGLDLIAAAGVIGAVTFAGLVDDGKGRVAEALPDMEQAVVHGGQDLCDELAGAEERRAVRVLVFGVDAEIHQAGWVEHGVLQIVVGFLKDVDAPAGAALELDELAVGYPQADDVAALFIRDEFPQAETLLECFVGQALVVGLQAALDVVDRHVVDPILHLVDQGVVVSLDDDVAVQGNQPADGGVHDGKGFAQKLVEGCFDLAWDEAAEVRGEGALAVVGPELKTTGAAGFVDSFSAT